MTKFAGQGQGFVWGRLIEAYLAGTEDNLSTLAARLRVPESTLRRQIRDGQSPTLNEVLEMTPRMPSPLRHMVVTAVAGEFYRVLANEGEFSRDAMGMAVAVDREASGLMGVVHQSLADGRIDADEAARINQSVHGVQRAAAGVSVAVGRR